MTERIGWTCGNCGGPVTGPYAECENCGRKPERIGMLNAGSASIKPGFTLSSTVSVGILVRVQWPLDDDPQNKALEFLHDLINLGTDEILNKPSKTESQNPYLKSGTLSAEIDHPHGVITLSYSKG